MAVVRIVFDLFQKFRSLEECVSAVEVVRVDDDEAVVQHFPAAKDCVCGAPGLDTLCRDLIRRNHVVHLLEHVLHLDFTGDAFSDGLVEHFIIFFFNYKDNPVKASLNRIVHGEIDDKFTVLGKGIDLLQSAVTRTHSGCQNKYCHNKLLLQASCGNIGCKTPPNFFQLYFIPNSRQMQDPLDGNLQKFRRFFCLCPGLVW